MIKIPKFIVTRFTHGAGGKFLSSVLQTSNSLAHWNYTIESYSNHSLRHDLIISYTERSFPVDPKFHLSSEPMVPYNTDLYSSTYDRGIDTTLTQFVEHAYAIDDFLFIKAVEQNKYINLIINKPFLPKFCYNSKVVTVLVETTRELDWLYRTLWAKHFFEQDNYIYYLPDHPRYCNFKNLPTILKYNNLYKFPLSQKEKIIEEKIINSKICQYYKNQNNFLTIDQECNIKNLFIPLSAFFNFDEFLNYINQIFVEFNLGELQVDLVKKMHSIWVDRQCSY